MTGEIRNPAKLPTDLNPVEKYFARCLAEGRPCKIRDGELPKKGIESGAGANLVRSEVIRFFAYGGNEENPVSVSIIILHGAWISEDLDLMHASIPYALMFNNCHFAASVMMQYAECAALYLNGSRLAQGLNADGLTTKGSVHLQDSFSAEGEVRLLGANIGGSLDCARGKFHNPDGYALSADGLTTKNDVNLWRGFFAKGEVRLLGANIGGSLDCTDGTFHNAGEDALSVDWLTTKGAVHLREGFSAKGQVRLLGASIDGDLDCTGGEFHNPGRNALSMDKLTTKGNVNLRNGFFAEGEVRLLGVDISGNLDCVGGKFHNIDGYVLNAEGGNISRSLLWRNITCEGEVSLGHASADVLADDSDSWKSCKVVLDGFTYNRFANFMGAQFRIDWLDKRPDGMGFSPLPYEQAAKVLFEMGHDNEAREILLEKESIRMRQEEKGDGVFSPVSHDAVANVFFAMGRNGDAREILLKRERLLTKRGEFPPIWRWGRKIWDVLAGYGYRPWRHTAMWMVVFFVIGAVIFNVADWYGNIVPTHPVVALSEDYEMQIAPKGNLFPTQAVKPEYPAFNPLVFSLDVFTPSAVFHQENSWAPRTGGEVWWVSLLLVLASLWIALILCFPLFAVIVLLSWLGFIEKRKENLLCGWGAGMFIVITGLVFICVGFLNILWFLTLWYWLEIAAGWILSSFFLLSIARLLRPRQSPGERD